MYGYELIVVLADLLRDLPMHGDLRDVGLPQQRSDFNGSLLEKIDQPVEKWVAILVIHGDRGGFTHCSCGIRSWLQSPPKCQRAHQRCQLSWMARRPSQMYIHGIVSKSWRRNEEGSQTTCERSLCDPKEEVNIYPFKRKAPADLLRPTACQYTPDGTEVHHFVYVVPSRLDDKEQLFKRYWKERPKEGRELVYCGPVALSNATTVWFRLKHLKTMTSINTWQKVHILEIRSKNHFRIPDPSKCVVDMELYTGTILVLQPRSGDLPSTLPWVIWSTALMAGIRFPHAITLWSRVYSPKQCAAKAPISSFRRSVDVHSLFNLPFIRML